MVSYILSILIFMIHLSTFQAYSVAGAMGNLWLELFLTEALPRFAVPMFFMLAGVAFFQNYTNASYLQKLRSRVRTLEYGMDAV